MTPVGSCPFFIARLVPIRPNRTGPKQVYQRNRSYDLTKVQFTQQDPIGLAGGLNLYGYAGGDPVNFSDPFGLCPPESRWTPECDKPLESAGLLDPVAWVTGGLAGGVRALFGRLAGRTAAAAAAEATATAATAQTTAFSAATVASQVASATGGAIRPLASSAGHRVTVQVGRRLVLARIKADGTFRVTIEGIGALTRAGEISSSQELTHLTVNSADEIIPDPAIGSCGAQAGPRECPSRHDRPCVRVG